MKQIKYLIISIILICIGIIIYYNKENIESFLKSFINKRPDIVLKEKNQYSKYYSFKTFSYLNTPEQYILSNKEQINNIIFNVLNNGYDELTFYCSEEYKECISDIKKTFEDSVLLSNINNYVSPFNSFKNIKSKVLSDGTVILTIEKTYSEEEINKLNSKINSLITQLNLNPLDNEKKIQTIHDYIIDNTEYDQLASTTSTSNFLSNKAIGPLFEGYGICSGYSDTMALFLDKLKIPNFKIASENHIWNLVYIDNEWLHLDLTWDDPINRDKSEGISHKFFLITSSDIKNLDQKEHNFNQEFYLEAK